MFKFLFCSQLFPLRKQNHKSYYPIIDDNFQLITFLLAHVSTKFKRQYIHNIFQSNVIMFQKPTIHLIPAKLIHICEARSSQLPCFSFYTFSHQENYILYKQGLQKMFITIIFSQARIIRISYSSD